MKTKKIFVIFSGLFLSVLLSFVGQVNAENNSLYLHDKESFAYGINEQNLGVDLRNCTIEFWVRLEHNYGVNEVADIFSIGKSTDGKSVFVLGEKPNHQATIIGLDWCDGTGTGSGSGVGSCTPISNWGGWWNHVVVTITESYSVAYINGKSLGAIKRSEDPNSLPFSGTSYQPTGVNSFCGCIDEIRVWNKVLTADEINSRYKTAVEPSTNNLVAYWDFNNGSLTDRVRGIQLHSQKAFFTKGVDLTNQAAVFDRSNYDKEKFKPLDEVDTKVVIQTLLDIEAIVPLQRRHFDDASIEGISKDKNGNEIIDWLADGGFFYNSDISNAYREIVMALVVEETTEEPSEPEVPVEPEEPSVPELPDLNDTLALTKVGVDVKYRAGDTVEYKLLVSPGDLLIFGDKADLVHSEFNQVDTGIIKIPYGSFMVRGISFIVDVKEGTRLLDIYRAGE